MRIPLGVQGKYDDLPEMAFYMVGDIKEVQEKADRLAKEVASRKEESSAKGKEAAAAQLKDLPSLEKMLADIKEEVPDADDDLTADFKAETISAETVVLNEKGQKMPLPAKK
jgi:F-type H+-transporting ATPase subunit beta